MEISVVIPVLNEEEGIDRCFSEVSAALDASGREYEIIFVDDGSTDGTFDAMGGYVESSDRVVIVKLVRNVGQQRAILIGMRYSRGDCVIAFDGDLQFSPKCLTALADEVKAGNDIVSGVRHSRKDKLLVNLFPSWFGRLLVNKALGVNVRDFGAVKGFSRRIVDQLVEIGTPVNVYATAYTLTKSHAEIPVEHRPRTKGRTKWSVIRRMEMYFDIFTAYAPRPFEWMMIVGFLLLLLSVVLFVGIVLYKIFIQWQFRGTIVFFDVFLFFTGLHLFSISLIGEFVVRTFRTARRSDETNPVEQVVLGPTGEPDRPVVTVPGLKQVTGSP